MDARSAIAAEHTDFSRWLCGELEHETHQSSVTGGLLPERPVCLSEVEAVALMILALDAQRLPATSCLTAGTVRRLTDTLRVCLLRLATS